MAADEHTDAGQLPPPGLFRTTHWGLVLGAKENSETALDALFQFYHRPLLIWLQKRANDYAPLEPEDLLQGFCEHLLGREFLSNVRPENGKFRTFLLASLKNYVRDRQDKENTLKRGGGQPLKSLQETDGQGQSLHDPAASSATPDVEFDRAWAQAILARCVHRLEAECARTGHGALCAALEPVMYADETAAPYREIAARLGLSQGAVAVAAHRIRARLRGILREEILQTVDREEDFQDELDYLRSLFGK